MQEYHYSELSNGLRTIHKEINHTKIAHVGIMLDIGSRDEDSTQKGITHFWEHMAFKGTHKRKSFHIINRLESLGGELNAYTTKEKICFYASILDIHIEKAVELLIDIVFNSAFPEKQIEKERQVILEEMSMYQDTPEDAIMDEFDEIVFHEHPLGGNILGTEQSVKSISKANFIQFIKAHINFEKIVFSSLGNISSKKIDRLINKHLAPLKAQLGIQKRPIFNGYKAHHQSKNREISQVHHLMGLPTYSLHDPKRIPFYLLTNILGGPAMNSRLNLSLREKHGFVYGVEAQFLSYTDIGLFSIGFATDPTNFKRSKALVLKEIKKLRNQTLSEGQLHAAKGQLKGQMAMSEENNNAMMLMMAKSLLDLNKIPSLDEVFKKIDLITALELREIAEEALQVDQMSSLTFMPH
jgi:predicted Zn-dependent peptidase